MKKKILFFLGGILIFLQGCTQDDHSISVSSAPSIQSPNNLDLNKDIFVKDIIANETSVENKKSPEQLILNQIQWKLSNDKLLYPQKEFIMGNKILGNYGFLVLKIPGLSVPWYNFIFLSSDGTKWDTTGLIDMSIIEPLSSGSETLKIPMNKYKFTSFRNLGSVTNNIWAFADDLKFVVIAKYPREPITPTSGTESQVVNGRECWLSNENNMTYLYYFDKENVVWISGNISTDETIKLAESLPPIEVYTFPFTE